MSVSSAAITASSESSEISSKIVFSPSASDRMSFVSSNAITFSLSDSGAMPSISPSAILSISASGRMSVSISVGRTDRPVFSSLLVVLLRTARFSFRAASRRAFTSSSKRAPLSRFFPLFAVKRSKLYFSSIRSAWLTFSG